MNDELSLTGTRQIGEGAPQAFTDHFIHILGFLNLGLPFLPVSYTHLTLPTIYSV